jgi:hypothetical protein
MLPPLEGVVERIQNFTQLTRSSKMTICASMIVRIMTEASRRTPKRRPKAQLHVSRIVVGSDGLAAADQAKPGETFADPLKA